CASSTRCRSKICITARFRTMSRSLPKAPSSASAPSTATPGGSLNGLHDKDYSIWFQATHPFIRSRGENLSLRARFEISSFDAKLGSTLVSSDDLRVLRLQLAYDRVDTFWLTAGNQAALELSQGIGVAGARTQN